MIKKQDVLKRVPKEIPIMDEVWDEYSQESMKIADYQSDIPKKIRFILHKLGISQYELAKQIRVPRQAINFWLAEKRKVDIYSAIWITKLYEKLLAKEKDNAKLAREKR